MVMRSAASECAPETGPHVCLADAEHLRDFAAAEPAAVAEADDLAVVLAQTVERVEQPAHLLLAEQSLLGRGAVLDQVAQGAERHELAHPNPTPVVVHQVTGDRQEPRPGTARVVERPAAWSARRKVSATMSSAASGSATWNRT
jgi:hypothetical protein